MPRNRTVDCVHCMASIVDDFNSRFPEEILFIPSQAETQSVSRAYLDRLVRCPEPVESRLMTSSGWSPPLTSNRHLPAPSPR